MVIKDGSSGVVADAVRCANCSGVLELDPETSGAVTCSYCGSNLVLRSKGSSSCPDPEGTAQGARVAEKAAAELALPRLGREVDACAQELQELLASHAALETARQAACAEVEAALRVQAEEARAFDSGWSRPAMTLAMGLAGALVAGIVTFMVSNGALFAVSVAVLAGAAGWLGAHRLQQRSQAAFLEDMTRRIQAAEASRDRCEVAVQGSLARVQARQEALEALRQRYAEHKAVADAW